VALILCLLVIGAPCPSAHHVELDRGGKARVIQLLLPIGRRADWECIHSHEGAWNDDTGNGYYGGLQMDWGFIHTYGRDMIAKYGDWRAGRWAPRDQMVVAQRAYSSGRGYYPWPQTARMCGLI
jgi:Transglycosylase-like domain